MNIEHDLGHNTTNKLKHSGKTTRINTFRYHSIKPIRTKHTQQQKTTNSVNQQHTTQQQQQQQHTNIQQHTTKQNTFRETRKR